MTVGRLAGGALIVLLAVPSYVHVAAQPSYVGVILSIEGSGWIRVSSQGPEIRLQTPRDLGRLLVPGQAVRSDGVRLTIKDGEKVEILTPVRGRYEIRSRSGLSLEAQRERDALNAFGRSGGSRGLGSPLYAPANQSAVRLETFRVRWIPRPGNTQATIELQDSGGRPFWTNNGVRLDAGELPGAVLSELTRLLGAPRSDNSGRWRLVLSAGPDVRWANAFTVMTPAEYARVARTLEPLSSEPNPLLRTIRRGYELEQLRLYNDQAEEYERALAATPGSESLRRAAVEAHDRTGNVVRAQELARSLPAR